MVPDALASIGDHPVPPSRLLSKHRPHRRAASSRSPLPPPASPGPALGLPDLTLCHCCGVRFPMPQPGAKPKRRPVRPLSSLWRIVLLCAECLSLVRSAAVCSYCLSLDNPPPEDSTVSCRRCKHSVHQSCIPAEHRTSLIQPVEVEDFLCVDCYPTVRPKIGGFNLGLNLEGYPRDPTSVAGGDILKSPSKGGKEGVSTGQFVGRGSGDPVLLDEDLALQLHLAMNGSQRISRSGNSCSGASTGPGKGKNGVVAGRDGNGNQEICITNVMAQLGDEEPGSNRVLKLVLALECVKGKHGEESMKAKRKGPSVTLQQDDLVNCYKKKYSKRSSIKQEKVEYISSRTMCDGKDMDGDHGVAPMK
ncbi:hypothetical protein SETIT_4G154200v2 [Setaria italica]|uniref:PHD-type domain-containing protein n=1 Tax=Setaria italica TaxID=4555 RepID=K3Y3I3_SETIT|nr:hypothetical protein SETIT_4G154200v2 [Setaria italica]